jgi:myosin-crossreactive antigen
MSAEKFCEDFQFMDNEKIELCRMLRDMIRKNKKCEKRIESLLSDFGFTFIEQINKTCLKLILKMEKSIIDGTFKDVFIKEEFNLNSINCFNVG